MTTPVEPLLTAREPHGRPQLRRSAPGLSNATTHDRLDRPAGYPRREQQHEQHRHRRQPGRRPHLRLTANGTPVASVTLAVTDRVKDPDGAWTDGPTAYYELTVWGSPADNFAETAVKGSRIVVAGELTVEEYTDRTGQTRTSSRITASHLGLSTRFAPRPAAQPTREAITTAR